MKTWKWVLATAALVISFASQAWASGCSLEVLEKEPYALNQWKVTVRASNGGCNGQANKNCNGLTNINFFDGDWSSPGTTVISQCDADCKGTSVLQETWVVFPGGYDSILVHGDMGITVCNETRVFFDLGDNCQPGTCCDSNTGGSINTAHGRAQTEQTDIILRGAGAEWPFTRYYATQWYRKETYLEAPFGRQWTYNLERTLSQPWNDAAGNQTVTAYYLRTSGSFSVARSGSRAVLSNTTVPQPAWNLIADGDGMIWIKENGERNRFRADHRLDYIQQPGNFRLAFDYDDAASTVTMTDYPSGRSLVLQKNANGRITGLSAPSSPAIAYQYNSSGGLTRVAQGAGAAETIYSYTYKGSTYGYYLEKIMNRNNEVVEKFNYATTGNRPVTTVDSPAHSYDVTYSATSPVTYLYDRHLGRQNRIQTDPKTFNLVASDECVSGCGAGHSLVRRRDSQGNLVWERSLRDAQTTVTKTATYDLKKNLVSRQTFVDAGPVSATNWSESFNGSGPLDPMRFMLEGGTGAGVGTALQSGGVLRLAFEGSPAAQYFRYTTKDLVKLEGDFTVRLDFRRLLVSEGDRWQAGAYLGVRPVLNDSVFFFAGAGRDAPPSTTWLYSARGLSSVGLEVGTALGPALIPGDSLQGALQLNRTQGVLTASFIPADGSTVIDILEASSVDPLFAAPMYLVFGLSANAAHATQSADFDALVVSADTVTYPSAPPASAFAVEFHTYVTESTTVIGSDTALPLDSRVRSERASLLAGHTVNTIYDYDADGDANFNANPTPQVKRVIRSGAVDTNSDGVLDAMAATYQCTTYGVSIGSTVYGFKTREYKPGPSPSCAGHPYVEYSYHPNGDLAEVRQCTAAGVCPLITSYDNYDALGNPQTVTDANGVMTAYTYDSLGRVLTQTADSGFGRGNFTTTYTYVGDHVASVIDPLGLRTQNVYGDPDAGNLDRLREVQKFDSTGTISEFLKYTYSVVNNAKVTVTESKNAAGATTRVSRVTEGSIDYTYLGLTAAYDYTETLEGSTPQGGAGQSGVVTRTIFNYEKQPIARIVDPGSASAQETAYFYDPLGRLSAVVDPLGTRTEYGYDAHGNLNLVVANALATPPQITSYVYDDFGRLIRSDSPDAGTTIYAYDPRGNLTAKRDARNITTSYSYDDFDRLTNIAYPNDPDVAYYYDGNCGPSPVCPATANAKGRLSVAAISEAQNNPYPRYFTYAYDARGNTIETRQVVSGQAYTTLYAYNAASQVIEATYPSGRVVQYAPQSADASKIGAVRAELSTLGLSPIASNVVYDPFGDVQSLTYGNGLNLRITRDLRSFPAEIKVDAPSSAVPTLDLLYTADPVGNIASIQNLVDPARDEAFYYDDLNQLIAADGPWGSYDWWYDALGNRQTEQLIRPFGAPGETTDYYYAPGTNRLEGSTTYDPPVAASYADWVLTLIYPKHHLPQGQPLEEQYYDLLEEMEWMLDRADGGKKKVYLAPYLANVRAFTKHAQLNPETVQRLLAEQGIPADLAQWFALEQWWDFRDEDIAKWPQEERDFLRLWLDYARLIQIVALEADPILNERIYRYDAAGSLAGETVSVYGADPSHFEYANNDSSHLTAATPTGAVGENYYYDHLNRRVLKAGPESRVFHYDLFGNLIGESKTDGTFTRDWIYLGSHRLAMVNMPQGGGGIPCGGCALAGGNDGGAIFLLLFGPALIAAGWYWRKKKFVIAGCVFVAGAVLLVMHPEAKGQAVNDYIYYYHNDHLGTPKVLTDQWQSVFWDADLEPFGSLIGTPSVRVDQPFRFPGQYADDLTGMYYNWNRYYTPGTGRYNRMDPLASQDRFIVSNGRINQARVPYLFYIYPRRLLSYSYPNNPILYIDREGMLGACILGRPDPRYFKKCTGKGCKIVVNCRFVAFNTTSADNENELETSMAVLPTCICEVKTTRANYFECNLCDNPMTVTCLEEEKHYEKANPQVYYRGGSNTEGVTYNCNEACAELCKTKRK